MTRTRTMRNGEMIRGKCVLHTCNKNVTDGIMICNDCLSTCEICKVRHGKK